MNCGYYFIYGLLLCLVAITCTNVRYLLTYILVCDKKHKVFIKSMKMEKK